MRSLVDCVCGVRIFRDASVSQCETCSARFVRTFGQVFCVLRYGDGETRFCCFFKGRNSSKSYNIHVSIFTTYSRVTYCLCVLCSYSLLFFEVNCVFFAFVRFNYENKQDVLIFMKNIVFLMKRLPHSERLILL